DLTVTLQKRSMSQGFEQQDRGVVKRELTLEQIDAVHDQVVLRDHSLHVRRAYVLLASIQAEARVERAQSAGRRVDLRMAHVAILEQDPPVEVRALHRLVIDQSKPPHPGRRPA